MFECETDFQLLKVVHTLAEFKFIEVFEPLTGISFLAYRNEVMFAEASEPVTDLKVINPQNHVTELENSLIESVIPLFLQLLGSKLEPPKL